MSVGKDQPQMAAVLPENKAKNRFTNVLPCKSALVVGPYLL